MVKRNKQEIYRAFGEYIFKGNEDFLNKEQLEIANQYKKPLKKLIKKSRRERKRHKFKKFILGIPVYILEGIYFVCTIIETPFYFLANKCDDLKVFYENKFRTGFKYSKNRKKVNDYAYNKVLPLLVEKEKEKDDGMYQKQWDYIAKIRKEENKKQKSNE